MGFQKAKRDLKTIYGHSDSESSDNERRKTLYVMFGGSWDITSHRIIKNLRREVAVATPTPRVAPHHRWMETSISFDPFDCPKSKAGVRQLPLLVSPTIINVKLYHILIVGGEVLNLISLVAFKKLQIPMSKLIDVSLGWAWYRSFHMDVSPSRSHSGCLRTSARKVSYSTSRRSTSPSMPFWAGRPSSNLWQLNILAT
jgi:hypothetical protein